MRRTPFRNFDWRCTELWFGLFLGSSIGWLAAQLLR